jgi:hypothetical protein
MSIKKLQLLLNENQGKQFLNVLAEIPFILILFNDDVYPDVKRVTFYKLKASGNFVPFFFH